MDADPSAAYHQTVSDIRPGTRFSGVLLVRASTKRTTQGGKGFMDLQLGDRTGTIPAKVWDWPGDPIPPNTILRVEGQGEDYNGHLQLKLRRQEPVPPEEGRTVAEFVPAAPETPENMLREIRETAEALRDDSLRGIVCKLLDWASEGGRLLSAPAAKSMHHATLGGLLHHTVVMLRAAKALAAVYRFLDKDLLFAGVIVHDLGKLDEMETDPDSGMVTAYSRDGRLVGHIVRGVVNVEKAAACTGASRERATLLQHLVLSHHGEAEFGSPVPPKFPEAEVLAAIDRLDAKLYEMHAALQGTKPGEFSQSVFGILRNGGKVELYRPGQP